MTTKLDDAKMTFNSLERTNQKLSVFYTGKKQAKEGKKLSDSLAQII